MMFYFILHLILLIMFSYPIKIEAQLPKDLVYSLQRVLQNGCHDWDVVRDGLFGTATLLSYQNCRDEFGLSPTDSLVNKEDIETFIDELWNRKLAVILLHQLGHLQGIYDLKNKTVIEDTLKQFSIDHAIEPSLTLTSRDITKLYKWYIKHPPSSSLGFTLKENNLPFAGLDIFIRAFKKEEKIQVFARRSDQDTAYVFLKEFQIKGSTFTYPIEGNSRKAGPKTIEGDFKVPEGSYKLSWQNRWSDFYLGYLLTYPSESDEIRRKYWKAGEKSGGAIVLHGERATIGCIPVGNPAIEEIFLLLNKNWSRDQQYGLIHIFPCRFNVGENEQILQQYGNQNPKLAQFWNSLRPVYHYFEQFQRLPNVSHNRNTGLYVLAGEERYELNLPPYSWLTHYDSSQSIINRIPVPAGYERIEVEPHTFADWLRNFPLKAGNPPVYLYNGEPKLNQNVHHAVFDLDVGNRDLQQCADAVIRLKAEYHYARDEFDDIHFNFTSGDTTKFRDWINGYRPVIKGRQVRWIQSGRRGSSYGDFQEYMEMVFTYAGTLSLSREMQSVEVGQMRIGDVFLKGGSPGHGILVIDMAVNEDTGKKLFLLAQSYMPAQDMHILKNPNNLTLSPWYDLDFDDVLKTPEWIFEKNELRRFSFGHQP